MGLTSTNMTDSQFHHWQYLVSQYFANTISKAELEELLEKTKRGEDLSLLTAELRKQWELKEPARDSSSDAVWNHLFAEMMQKAGNEDELKLAKTRARLRTMRRLAVAVVIILALGVAGYLNFGTTKPAADAVKKVAPASLKNDLLPGKAGAILTLADGKTISLDSAGNQVLAVQGNTTVRFDEGQIIYDEKAGIPAAMLYNTIETPRGRQFQLLLADGSKVWLNAASSIRFPASFDGKERKVEITGEAYFEVATVYSPDLKGNVPFKVQVTTSAGDAGFIEVHGTHFNVNTYDQKGIAKTTLLEGSVSISKDNNTQLLTPGQQALVKTENGSNSPIRIAEHVDVEQVMAWKNGYFSFANTDLEGVMQQIARWYDVEIVYEGKIPQRKFGGEISRNNNASQVLKVLEESKVHFRIEGKKIVVLP